MHSGSTTIALAQKPLRVFGAAFVNLVPARVEEPDNVAALAGFLPPLVLEAFNLLAPVEAPGRPLRIDRALPFRPHREPASVAPVGFYESVGGRPLPGEGAASKRLYSALTEGVSKQAMVLVDAALGLVDVLDFRLGKGGGVGPHVIEPPI